MTPRTRLLVWFSIVVLPLALFAGVEAGSNLLALAGITAFAFVSLIDLGLAQGKLDRIVVELPGVVRLSKDREGSIDLRLRNDLPRELPLWCGLALPRALGSRQEILYSRLPGESQWVRLNWPCLPTERGSYLITEAFIETASPLRLWSLRGRVRCRCEIRVYPNLRNDRKRLAALFLSRGMFGVHARRQVGRGRDFEKLREYIPGDSFDEIHWKATAKRTHPVTKVFQVERTQEVYVVIDFSRLSARTISGRARTKYLEAGSSAEKIEAETPLLERFLTLALILALAAEQQGDLFGLLTFAEKVTHFVRARSGPAHYDSCRDALYALQPKGATPDFDEVCSFIRVRLRRRALLVFLTALDDPVLAENFVRNIDLIRRQHLVLVNMAGSPRAQPVFSDPNVATLDDLYEHLSGHLQWQRLKELGKILQRKGVKFSLLDHEKMSVEIVSQYLEIKRRQIL